MLFNNEKLIKRSRKRKYCSCCGKTMKAGESSYSIPTRFVCIDCYNTYIKNNNVDILKVKDLKNRTKNDLTIKNMKKVNGIQYINNKIKNIV